MTQLAGALNWQESQVYQGPVAIYTANLATDPQWIWQLDGLYHQHRIRPAYCTVDNLSSPQEVAVNFGPVRFVVEEYSRLTFTVPDQAQTAAIAALSGTAAAVVVTFSMADLGKADTSNVYAIRAGLAGALLGSPAPLIAAGVQLVGSLVWQESQAYQGPVSINTADLSAFGTWVYRLDGFYQQARIKPKGITIDNLTSAQQVMVSFGPVNFTVNQFSRMTLAIPDSAVTVQLQGIGSASAAVGVTFAIADLSKGDTTNLYAVQQSVQAGYLPLTGGTLSGPGNLAVGGTLAVTGASTLSGLVTIANNLTLNGNVVGGLTFGSVVAASPTDLSNHIGLWGTGGANEYGFSVTSNTLNLVSNGAATVQITSGGATVNGTLTTSGTILNNNGKVIAHLSGGNPGFTVWDPAQGMASIFFFGGGAACYVGSADGNGNYIGPVYQSWAHDGSGSSISGTLNVSSNATVSGSFTTNGITGTALSINGSDVVTLTASGAGWAIVRYNNGNRAWWLGNRNDGVFTLFDQSAGLYRMTCDTGGNWSLNGGGVTITTNQNVQGWLMVGANGISYQRVAGSVWMEFLNTSATNLQFYTQAVARGVWGFNTPSDVSLKRNIAPAGDALAQLCQLEVVSFDWKDPERWGRAHVDYGFTAQQVEPVIEELIVHMVDPDGDCDGLPVVTTTELIPRLVRAVQQLARRVEQLEASA